MVDGSLMVSVIVLVLLPAACPWTQRKVLANDRCRVSVFYPFMVISISGRTITPGNDAFSWNNHFDRAYIGNSCLFLFHIKRNNFSSRDFFFLFYNSILIFILPIYLNHVKRQHNFTHRRIEGIERCRERRSYYSLWKWRQFRDCSRPCC